MPELRKDIVTREWVIISKERAKRPHDFAHTKKALEELPEHDKSCPFCTGNEEKTPPEVLVYRPVNSGPNSPGWLLRVTPNKYQALISEGDLNRENHHIYDHMNGVGAHEVVIECPEHNQTLATMDDKQVERVVWSYIDRYNALREDTRLKYFLVFRNHGVTAGCSLAHPHSQIVATPIIPQKVWGKVRGVTQYREYRDKCVYCDIIATETHLQERVICENGSFTAIAPFASRSPFETWILPKNHRSCFAKMSRFEVEQFSAILKDVLGRLHRCLNNPPYNYMIITSPNDTDTLDTFHWYLEITPRLTTPAGFEIGTSIYINIVPPEAAAQYLREA